MIRIECFEGLPSFLFSFKFRNSEYENLLYHALFFSSMHGHCSVKKETDFCTVTTLHLLEYNSLRYGYLMIIRACLKVDKIITLFFNATKC